MSDECSQEQEDEKKCKLEKAIVLHKLQKTLDLAKEHIGFKALTRKLAAGGHVTNPSAVAASIGRKKYGKEKFQSMAAKGRKKS